MESKMKSPVQTFKLEDYFNKYEFSAPHLLCCSDAESFTLQELISLADSESLALWENLHLGYTEPKGLPKLRTQIAESLYLGLSAENITCFSGAEEGIFAALNVLCKKGDHVIAFGPCYQSLIEIPKACGAEVTTIDLKPENEWRINIDEVKQAIKPNTKCIIINFPHNPTGQIITDNELSQLVNICKKK